MDKKIVTYSLLAHINNTGRLSKSFDNIFIPLIKRGLAKMCSTGQFNGDSIEDIKLHIDEIYGLDMPLPVLRRFLKIIEIEINKDGIQHIKFYNDGAFIIKNYVFDELEEDINKNESDVAELERVYGEFLNSTSNKGKIRASSIFEFVEQNKFSLGRYINKKYPIHQIEDTLEADFVNFIKAIPYLYTTLQSIYIGSIVSTYLEYEPSDIKAQVELVLDTNFVISLLDLNTPDSTTNCKRLLEIGKKLGYRFTVLNITLREIDQLLKIKVDNYDSTFLSRLVDKEDIYNACQRRSLSKTDLERIKFNVEGELLNMDVLIVSYTEKYENRARNSEDFEKYKKFRNTEFAALHDATCNEYVREKRGNKPVYSFEKVNCWFVNNSSSKGQSLNGSGAQPPMIKGEDLLNMLWLASPSVKSSLSFQELADIGLSRMVSTALNESLPSSLIIKELDENIRKYAKDNISHHDVVRISKSLAQRSYVNIEHLNEIAEKDAKQFVEELQSIADEQKLKEEERAILINKLIEKVEQKNSELDEEKKSIVNDRAKLSEVIETNSELVAQVRRAKYENLVLQNQIRKPLRESWIRRRIIVWRCKPFFMVLGGVIVVACFLLYINIIATKDKSPAEVFEALKKNVYFSIIAGLLTVIYTGLCIKIFSDRFNQSALVAFKNGLEIPDNLKELKD